MNIQGKHYHTIWVKDNDPATIQIIDQRPLPHEFVIEDIQTPEQMATAISEMHVRGAPLIGAAGAYGMYLAVLNHPHQDLTPFELLLKNSRPTAVNLFYGVDAVLNAIEDISDPDERIQTALQAANDFTAECIKQCRQIGIHGLDIIKKIAWQKPNQTINILTHCNAGWLACVDYGTATAPIYAAHDAGLDIHVWVDETRPRNQGARLTAFELAEHGVPHTVIADNTGGHLMQHGQVDLCIVGSDRTTRTGDVCNKIGTYLKALAAKDNNVPFYVALPSSTFDWEISDGIKGIPIEQRNGNEVKYIQGKNENKIRSVLLTPEQSPAMNYAFDVTPSRLVTGLITERGVCEANETSILKLFPEKSNQSNTNQ